MNQNRVTIHCYFLILILLFPQKVSIAQDDCPYAENPVPLFNPVIFGNGTAGSCTATALQNAFDIGGHIACNCGANPISITINSPINVSTNAVFDGGNKITLNGNNNSRILDKQNGIDFTIQNTTLVNGKAPGPNGHFTNQCGGAILARGGGIIKAINCSFENNSVTSLDASDIAGGAVYVFAELEGVFSGCSFSGNSASNGGAIGGLGSDILISNCVFNDNMATGTSGGLRGHGGAINLDGVEIGAANKIYSVCGSDFIGNNAETQGGASNTVFSDHVGARLEMDQCSFEGNYLRHPTGGNGGAIFHVVDDVDNGVNEQQFSIRRSSFIGNHCSNHGGGIWALIVGQGIIENCTFFQDSVSSTSTGLGGAIIFSNQINGQGGWLIKNNTLAKNYAGLFGGGCFASSSSIVTWKNNILSDNYHSNINPWVGLSVNRTMDIDGGGNFQWPEKRPNGSDDIPATPTVQFINPSLEIPPADHGGPTNTIALLNGSPAIDFGNQCSCYDQRLFKRSGACDSGAFATDGVDEAENNLNLSGIMNGNLIYNALNNIVSDAFIQSNSNLGFDACNTVLLNPGFEVEANATFHVW